MRIIPLGTSAGRPTLQRSASAVALEYEGDIFLFDCGEGTQTQLARSALKWGSIRGILIGHLHGDHVYGLPGLLATLSMSERTEPMEVFGPPGLKEYFRVLRAMKSLWIQFPVRITEIRSPGIIWEKDRYQIETARLDHTIECWGYVFREKPRAGLFDEQKAVLLGIPPGPLRGRLVKGETIQLPDGKVITPDQVVGPKGREDLSLIAWIQNRAAAL